jgi:hypothetical protein
VIFVGLADGASLHRPGQRFAVDAAARACVEQARAEGIREMCDAWKTPPTAEFRGQQPGDQCTINGASGHLNHRLECIPDRRQDAMDARERTYREMVDDLQNAWRRPDASIEPRATADVPRTMTADAAQRIKDAAWLQSVKDLESAWKGPAR